MIDPKSGLPLIGERDLRPVKIEILSDGNPMTTVIRDAETKRPIDGVASIKWILNASGESALVMEFAPESYMLVVADAKLTAERHPPAHLVDIKTDKPVSLKDGDIIRLMTPKGSAQGVLTASIFQPDTEVEGEAKPSPEAPRTEGIEGSGDDTEGGEERSRPALGERP